jgi:hypothetical protein
MGSSSNMGLLRQPTRGRRAGPRGLTALCAHGAGRMVDWRFERIDAEDEMQKNSGKKKEKCKNCEGKGLIKNGDKKMKCQRCGGTGFKP